MIPFKSEKGGKTTKKTARENSCKSPGFYDTIAFGVLCAPRKDVDQTQEENIA